MSAAGTLPAGGPAPGSPTAALPAPGAMPAGSHLRAIADRGHLTVGVLADVTSRGLARDRLTGIGPVIPIPRHRD
ncbi:hypothetical protein [Parafrankia elaeagni]|uniref:hypothetical protein n=1 Tax=Parafrankia elaeagni TaxID=222534 RepID=UPI0003824518|nr:hypothetical protein [Parafrankia elaeagni]